MYVLLNDFLYYLDAKNSGITAILITLVAALLLKLSLLQQSKIFRIISSCIIIICLVFIIFLGSQNDNCHQLQTLRTFRDNHLLKSNSNRSLVQNYYFIAPQLVRLLEKDKNRKRLFRFIFQR